MTELLPKEEYLETLEGCEVSSIRWEGVVMVKDGQFIQYGKVICADPTVEQAKALMDEAFFQEFGTNDVWEVIEDEFGQDEDGNWGYPS